MRFNHNNKTFKFIDIKKNFLNRVLLSRTENSSYTENHITNQDKVSFATFKIISKPIALLVFKLTFAYVAINLQKY